VSEKIDGLEPFHPERMASRILGMGDVLSLIEGAQKNLDVEEAQRFAKKMKSGKGFDLDDYKAQIAQMRKMGGLAAMLDKMPAELARAAQGTNVDERKIARVEGIINSMTPGERTNRDPQGVAQTPHRVGGGRFGAGGQPAPEPVRAGAEDDENDGEGRDAEDDAGNEGFHAAGALMPA
jgi:signal recognition particle GTPase